MVSSCMLRTLLWEKHSMPCRRWQYLLAVQARHPLDTASNATSAASSAHLHIWVQVPLLHPELQLLQAKGAKHSSVRNEIIP